MQRPVGIHDGRFLRDMLRHAYHCRIAEDTERPVYRYVQNWGRRGDAGVLAPEGPHAYGAACYQLFTDDEPGYGVIDAQAPELGGTCLRVGCIPTKAWVQTAFALREVEESFAKFGVQVSGAQLDFGASNAWKAGVVQQMTSGVASLFKANGVEWVKGRGRFN